ncbi:hypothetical protein [Agrobacterium rubi]|nr:hypothetical protein [Agrobacterium rubi]NTE89567.1 hypothetical protein [Agrobacterium rubi]NTF05703.1 hypothetical protein [Agrobacterium rubi]
MGLREAERRKFDYGCMLLRDTTRPLVSQVLWNHEEGLEKDLRTLLFEGEAALKIYFVRDRIRNRAKIDEAIQSYRLNQATATLLRGLKIIAIPEGFDADSEVQRVWMDKHILETVSSDLLFAVVFGKLTAQDVRVFAQHGGPIGLKIAVLHAINTVGLEHGPTFEKQLGMRGSPLREVIAMLTGVGLVVAPAFSIQRVPTLKGRFLLDLARLLTFERETLNDWSDETKMILRYLNVDPTDGWQELDERKASAGFTSDLIISVRYAAQFGMDIMDSVGANPNFHSTFLTSNYLSGRYMGATEALWRDPEDVALFR